MAAIALGTSFTLAELIRREDPNGKLAQLVDVLSETNAILQDATFIECNNGTYHEDTRTATEPSGDERAYNEGVAAEAGVTEKVTEPTCMLDGLSEIESQFSLKSNCGAVARPSGLRRNRLRHSLQRSNLTC